MKTLLYAMLVMALTTYLIRMIPFVFCRRKIKNRFVRRFLYYIPYAVLSAMTIPAIFFATGDLPSAIAGTAVALVLAFWNVPLILVALSASLTAYLVMCLQPLL